ncbi:NAD(P)/FAD-dependent oxidoreductase [Salinibacterium hongtaonis]|uniref:FAD-dependent oxidoreductase n=1 Tax=Homoserinimonas hongtaonis TaxID=2079791 RepID=A0A2U1T2T7_9MICO|nr:FAD-dependent oxidoreductase [Salinibacterium hongtaonis]PWB98201.1 FAD-dependent oxidoreductase [Salinibacterium hongtaonis]
MSAETLLIVGGGLAAATAAEQLRANGFAGTIRIIAAERHRPYIRPPLSKGYLLGTEGRDAVDAQPAEWYEENGIELILGAIATSVDPAGHHVGLADGRAFDYDRLLLATGASPRHLELPGAQSVGVHYLRTLDQSDDLRAALSEGGRTVAVVGAGWIGLELAAAAQVYGNEVTVIGRGEEPLQAAIGVELGRVFRRMHEEHGVRFRMQASPQSFIERDGAVAAVVTESGEVAADLVIVGAGVVPATALAASAGLIVLDGIVVDESLRSSDTDIFAAGDVANPWNAVLARHARSEHWANAIASGTVAAKTMLDIPAVLDDVPYFYTDQYDLGMEFSGYSSLLQTARVVYRGDVGAREFMAFWLAGDRVVAGMNVNVWDVQEQIVALVRSLEPVDREKLADPSVPLASLAG